MKLQNIHIHKEYSGTGYTGAIQFKNQSGEVSLRLDNDFSNKILAVCSEAIVQSAKDVADQMLANIIEHNETQALIGEDS